MADGKADTLRRGLDGAWSVNVVAPSPDGRLLYLALASDSMPPPSARHVPDADRDLDIYSLDPQTGKLRLVAQAPNDDCCPVMANGYLYWTHNEPTSEIVLMPIAGGNVQPGAARTIARGGFLARFSPDARQVAYTKGSFRLADYGLDMDEWVVSLDSAGRASEPRPLVVGFGEDMGATWSPDGKWLAFHSHRARTPYAMYDSPEHSDDIWIRRANQPSGEEIRLTDFGWEVSTPDWAPDSRHLLFESWEKGGNPAIAKPWIVTIDPATGRAAGLERVPLPAGVQGTKFEAWSPKGNEVVLVQRIDGGHQALWISGIDGTNARRTIDYPSYTYGGVTWTPDGGEIWYAAIAEGRMEIFAIPAGGGTARQITRDAANMMHPAISRDGNWLVATRVLWRKQLRRIRLSP
jgi:Tol biopolymer transport system component